MRKVIAALIVVLAIWVGAEVSDRGVDGAFGGLFAGGSVAKTETLADRSTAHRTSDAFQRAYDKSESRVNRLLEPPPEED
jgi:hypothetical protein